MGGLVHYRPAYWLAIVDAKAKAKPAGDPTVGLDTSAPHLTTIMSAVLVPSSVVLNTGGRGESMTGILGARSGMEDLPRGSASSVSPAPGFIHPDYRIRCRISSLVASLSWMWMKSSSRLGSGSCLSASTSVVQVA